LSSFDCFSDRVADYLASQFWELPVPFLNILPVSALEQLLSQDSLKIDTEDSLLTFISSRFGIDNESVRLLEFVRFEHLTPDGMGQFVSWSLEHFDDIAFTLSVWTSITKRLSLGVHCPVWNSTRHRQTSHPTSDSPLDGIIAALTKECGGNVNDQTIVKVAASAFDSSDYPKNAADLGNTNHFQTPNQPNQWLRYDFINRRVKLTDYAIAAHTNNYFLRSWVVEGSNDGDDGPWVSVHSREENTEAHPDHPIATFSVPSSDFYRFIRLRQTGKNANGTHYLILHGFEVFGFVTDASINHQSSSTS
jgi:hypothetical protein